MFTSSTMFLSVIFSFLFPLVTALVPAAAHAAASGDFAGLIDIGGGRKMYLECRGTGSPTVVLVGGLRASAEDWGIADKSAPAALHKVSKFTRVCACDRPGTPVDSVPQPATAGDAVADLHALLTAVGEAKPYVLWRSDSQALCEHLSGGRIRSRPRRCAQRRDSGCGDD